jgi:hypothetical protein
VAVDAAAGGNLPLAAVLKGMAERSTVDDPQHWRRRAQEARRIAEQLDDPAARTTMQEIAVSYERLAELAHARRAARSPG